jgi:hypothetical protein
MNTLARYETFQEAPEIGWSPTNTTGLSFFWVSAPWSNPEARFSFTQGGFPANPQQNRRLLWSNWGSDQTGGFSIRDCQFANCYLYISRTDSGGVMDVNFSNNLFEYGSLVFYQTNSGNYPFTLTFKNNLMRGGTLDMAYHSDSTAWDITDNLFDYSNRTLGSFPLNASHNAYHTILTLGGTNNLTVATLDFQPGPLGNYYYPTNGTNLNALVDAGSQTAVSAGLYHHTTTIDQAKEAASSVDIGFHYVATDENGLPLDYDGDTLPDYLEDANGNGTADTGETDWQQYNSPNGLGETPWIMIYSPVR